MRRRPTLPSVQPSRRASLGRAALVAALALPALAACRAFGGGGGNVVSSERSDYTPVLRLEVATRAAGDSVIVDVRRGTALAQDFGTTTRVPTMRGLVLTPLLVATPADAGDSVGIAKNAPWAAIAEGAPAPLADSLVPGVAHPVAPRRWVIRRPATAPDARRTWLVFRVTGDAVTRALQMADGSVVPPARIADGVRVYACSERDVTGRVDRARARRQRAAYGEAC